MMIALLWGLMYLISDLLYAIIDPRVRLSSKAA
jgi:ABC-type dipeptide/oligopeptide/nickel transport system permease component